MGAAGQMLREYKVEGVQNAQCIKKSAQGVGQGRVHMQVRVHMQARPGYICITLIVKRSATKFPYLPAGTDAERCL